MSDEAVLFGRARSLVGILSDGAPRRDARVLPAVIFLNAGAVHRVGPHRLYVKAARMLAALGFTTLRFDFSGTGDSGPRTMSVYYEQEGVIETREAMDFLSRIRGCSQFVLIGLCSGAITAFQAACADRRVVGIVPINGRGEVAEEHAAYAAQRQQSRYYWRAAFFDPRSWWKALTGKADYRTVLRALMFPITSRSKAPPIVTSRPDEVAVALQSLMAHRVHVLAIYSSGDLGLDYFEAALGQQARHPRASGATDAVTIRVMTGTDHTFTPLAAQRRLLHVLREWATATWLADSRATTTTTPGRDRRPSSVRTAPLVDSRDAPRQGSGLPQ